MGGKRKKSKGKGEGRGGQKVVKWVWGVHYNLRIGARETPMFQSLNDRLGGSVHRGVVAQGGEGRVEGRRVLGF